ncbi:MAG: hypothetical protein ABSC50_07200 [Candidatus Bathyarchaeia archaeon]
MIGTTRGRSNLGRHILAYALAVHFFFGSISVLNELGLSFFFYYPRTIRIIIFDARIDLLVWVASVLCVSAVMLTALPKGNEKRVVQVGLAILSASLGLALLSARTGLWVYFLFLATTGGFGLMISLRDEIFEQPSKSLIILTLVYLLAILATIEISSAVQNSLQAFNLNTPIGKQDAGTELQLSYASYGLIPWLYVAFLFSWAWVPLVQRFLPQTARLFERAATPISREAAPNQSSLVNRILDLLDPRLLLALAVAVFIGYYTYFQNPPWIVGTDAYWRYYDPLVRISTDGPLSALGKALGERHPIPLMILYVGKLVFQVSFLDIVRMAQVLLVVLLAMTMAWFLACRKDFNFGLTGFLLSVLSVTTTVGFYSSILANWMALVVWVLFFAYLVFRTTEKLRAVDFLVLFLLSTLILFIHPWTWGVFATAVLVAAILGLIHEKRRGLRTAGLLVGVIVADIALALGTISYLAASQGWRVMDALGYYTFVIDNPSSVFWFWDALTWLTRIWSPFFSPLYIAVSIIGVFTLRSARIGPWCKRLMFAWLFVSAIGSILVAPVGFNVADPSGSETQLWRLLYLTPFPVLAPFGIAWLNRLPERQAAGSEEPLHQNGNGRFSGLWLGFLVLVGIGLAWAGLVERLLLVLFLLPLVTSVILIRTRIPERRFLSALILAVFVLVAYNSTTRALSQLLRDPHNYRPLSNSPLSGSLTFQ